MNARRTTLIGLAIALLSVLCLGLAGCGPQVARSETRPGHTTISRTIEDPGGQTTTTTATINTPSNRASGDAVESQFDIPEHEADLVAGTVRVGKSGGVFAGDAIGIPSGPTPYLMVPGVLCLGLAAFAGYRARVGLALVVGAFGAGLIAGAFYPVAFILSAAALAGGAFLYFRGDLARGAIETAFARTAAIVETEAPGIKEKIRKTTPVAAKKAAGRVLKREGVS